MTRYRGAVIRLLCSLALLVLQPAVTPADARGMSLAVTSSGLIVEGIPLPAGAEPALATNLSLEELQAMAPGSVELGRGRLQAVVYELHLAAPPDAVADFYVRELHRPMVREGRSTPGKAPDDGIRVLSFPGKAGYLAIHAEEEPSRVTVAMVQGSVLPAVVLAAVDKLRAGEGPKPSQAPALLSPPWETDVTFQGIQVDLVKRSMERGEAPGPVVDVMRALLRQARSLHLMKHQVPHQSAPVVLAAFRDEAWLQSWRLMSVESGGDHGTLEVVALYRLPNDNGMVMLRAGPPQSPRMLPRSALLLEVSRLEVMGPIDFAELFRPSPPRPAAQRRR